MTRSRRGTPLPPIRLRLTILLAVMTLAFVGIGARLVELQARDQTHLRSLGVGQRVRTVTLAAERGSIFDRNGVDLALSVPQTTIVADPSVIRQPGNYASKLAPVVVVDAQALQARLSDGNSRFAYVARKVDDATVARVKALHLTGLSYVPESKRFYPSGLLAAPVLGFVGTDNYGLGGLEAQYEKTIRGYPGEARVERDPQGNDIPGGGRILKPAERGKDIVLTIDQSVQANTEHVLTQQVEDAHAKGGLAIVADVLTGDILAMATVDGASDDRPAGPTPANEQNRPATIVYEPGSTNKVITMAGAIEEGLVTPDTVLEGIGGQVVVGGTTYSDVDSHPSTMTVAEILEHSSNVGTIKIASMLGKERFDHYLRAFGFGQATALGFPGEANYQLLPLDQYNDTSMGSMPIGNGIAVSAIQMLDVYMTIANGGMSRSPRLVEATVEADGEVHELPLLAPHRVISPTTASALTGMLELVVEGGTGVNAQVTGYRVAGKTGTARKPPYEHPPYRYVASFVGFAPANSPRLAAIVVLDEPIGNYFGGGVAAPAFAQIMQQALGAERVPPAP
ncbi:MAG: penicillin-binding protein 2 [Acidimicrobiia bacterium]